MIAPAPVALFAYNRPDHTAATLEALGSNEHAPESDLTVFCDGPRVAEHAADTERVREIAKGAQGFRSVTVIERESNMGLARSVISGVSEMLEVHDRVIVLEDDLVTSPFFLGFMNEGLEVCADEERVLSICGYTFPVDGALPDSFFLPGAFCWGWATWRRAWALFEHDAEKMLSELVARDRIYEFDFRGTDPLTRILQRAVNKEAGIDSWALRWMATACLNEKVTLYPGQSLVANEGFDGSGVHADFDSRFVSPMARARPRVRFDSVRVLNNVMDQHRRLFIRWRTEGSFSAKAYYALASRLPRRWEKRLYTTIVGRQLLRNTRAG